MIQRLWILCLCIVISSPFQFIFPTIDLGTLRINTATTYTFTITRSYDSLLNPTAWDSELVPANSDVIIYFPAEYDAISADGASVSCSFLMINNALVTDAYTCVEGGSSGTHTLTISGSITSATAVENMVVGLQDVLNPAPALTTGTFVVKVGQDLSANTTGAATLTLEKADLTSCSISFNPAAVNTTGDMEVYVGINNQIPKNGWLEVKFPPTLQWQHDISTNHQLPIGGTLTCQLIDDSSLFTFINSISCVGSTSTQIVTVTPVYGAGAIETALTGNFAFKIKDIFSPPTTEPVDSIEITSVDPSGFGLDHCASTISGLQPRTMSVNLVPTVSPFYVNINSGIIIHFTLADTIQKTDYFVLEFPSGSSVTYIFKTGSISLAANTSYSSVTQSLTFYQSSSNSQQYENSVQNITFLTYRAPPSTRETEEFRFVVLSENGYEKAAGVSTLQAVQKVYTINVSPDTYQVSAVTNYTVQTSLTDTLTSAAFIQVIIPSQLTPPTECPTLTPSSTIIENPPCAIDGNKITITSINASSSNIGSQTVTIQLLDVVNHYAEETISDFQVKFYYTSDSVDLVGVGSEDGLSMLAAQMLVSDVSMSNTIVSGQNVEYQIDIQLATPTQPSSILQISWPDTISMPANPTVSIQVVNPLASHVMGTTFFNASTLSVSLESVILPTATTISINIEGVQNPPTTRPFNLSVATTTSTGSLINYYNQYQVTTLESGNFQTLILNRDSEENFAIANYQISAKLAVSQVETDSVMLVTFPLSFDGTPKCFDGSNSSSQISCTVNNDQITIPLNTLTTSTSTSTEWSVIVTNVINPSSFEPSSYFDITVQTSDGYFYSESNNDIFVNNTIAPVFPKLQGGFTNAVYGEEVTDLQIQMQVGIESDNIKLDLSEWTYGSISCTSSVDITCSLTGSMLNLQPVGPVLPTSFSFTVSNLLTPLTQVNPTIEISASINSYLINEETIQFQPSCEMPCATCQSDNTSCLSCYSQSLALTPNIYFYNNLCYQVCPLGTLLDNITCVDCSSSCVECAGSLDYCTACDNTTFSYLNATANTSECVDACPPTTYQSTTSCLDCVEPCAQCTSDTVCTSCMESYYTLVEDTSIKCVAECPEDVTVGVLNDSNVLVCEYCDASCLTCSELVDNCTSCSNSSLYIDDPLLPQACVSQCPSPLISINQTCYECSSPCATCESSLSNCLSCLPSFYMDPSGDCVASCPQLSFQNDTAQTCDLCSSIPDLNCLNCSSPTTCYQCDDPSKPNYVYFSQNSSCLPNAPPGYVDIGGEAVPCANDCVQCEGTTTNCTKCDGNNSLYVDGNGTGECVSVCPIYYTGVNNVCEECISPCLQCEGGVNDCTACLGGFYEENGQCVSDCAHTTYANDTTQACQPCVSPCGLCLNTTYCLTCQDSILSDDGVCIDACPETEVERDSSVIIDSISYPILQCISCLSPCVTCSGQRHHCTSCQTNYFYSEELNRCFTDCPDGSVGLVSNGTRICDPCVSPCRTCENTVSDCLSCVSGQYLDVLTEKCVKECPDGYYGSQGNCRECTNNCDTCSSASICLTCQAPRYFYNSQCVTSCPASHAIIIDNTCTQCESGCQSCSSAASVIDSSCTECSNPYILYESHCITTCPSPLIFYHNNTSNKYQCLTQEEYEETTQSGLNEILTISSLLPFPFTIAGAILCVATFMSRLQKKNTYITGLIYCWFGALQVGSFAYVLLVVYSATNQEGKYQLQTYSSDLFLFGLIVLGVIGGFNLLALCTQTPFLLADDKFSAWIKEEKISEEAQNQEELLSQSQSRKSNKKDSSCCGHGCSFFFVSFFSLIISYKIKIIIFTKLFGFSSLSAELQSVQKFRIFNLFSFLGVLHEGVVIYVAYSILKDITYDSNSELFMVCIDLIIVTVVSFILALISAKKQNNFFDEADSESSGSQNQDHSGNKKSKKQETSKKKNDDSDIIGMDSMGVIKPRNHDDDQELSLSLTESLKEEQQSKQYIEPVEAKEKPPNHNIISQFKPFAIANQYWVQKEEKQIQEQNEQLESPRESERTKKIPAKPEKLKKEGRSDIRKIPQKYSINSSKRHYENLLYKSKKTSKTDQNNQTEILPENPSNPELQKNSESMRFSNPNEKVMLQDRSFQQILPFVHVNDELIYKKKLEEKNIFEVNDDQQEDAEKDSIMESIQKQKKQKSLSQAHQNKPIKNAYAEISESKNLDFDNESKDALIKENFQEQITKKELKNLNQQISNIENKEKGNLQKEILSTQNKQIELAEEDEIPVVNLTQKQDKKNMDLGQGEKKNSVVHTSKRSEIFINDLSKKQSQSYDDLQEITLKSKTKSEKQVEKQLFQGKVSEEEKQSQLKLNEYSQKKEQLINQNDAMNKTSGFIDVKNRSNPPSQIYRSRKNLQHFDDDQKIDSKIQEKEQKLSIIKKSIINREKDIKRKKSREKIKNRSTQKEDHALPEKSVKEEKLVKHAVKKEDFEIQFNDFEVENANLRDISSTKKQILEKEKVGKEQSSLKKQKVEKIIINAEEKQVDIKNDKEDIKNHKKSHEDSNQGRDKKEKQITPSSSQVRELYQSSENHNFPSNTFKHSRNYERSVPINSFDESSLPFKKQVESQEKLSNPFEASIVEEGQRLPELHQEANEEASDSLQPREKRKLQLSPDDTLPYDQGFKNKNIQCNPITEQNSQMEVSENDPTRKPYEYAFEDNELEDDLNNKKIDNLASEEQSKGEKLMDLLDRNKLQGFKRKERKEIPNQPSEEESFGFKGLARANIIGNLQPMREQSLSKKQTSHPLQNSFVKKLSGRGQDSFQQQDSFKIPKARDLSQKKSRLKQERSEVVLSKHNDGESKKQNSNKSANEIQPITKIKPGKVESNLLSKYDSSSQLVKWVDEFSARQKSKSGKDESMDIPSKPRLIHGIENEKSRKGRKFDYEDASYEIIEEQRYSRRSRSGSKGRSGSKSNSKHKNPRTSLEKIYTQKLSRK